MVKPDNPQRRLKKLILLMAVVLLSACSGDSLEELEEITAVPCALGDPEAGCSVVFLEGQQYEWVKIPDPGDLEDPYFLYALGKTDEPRGTVSISLRDGNPLIRINDAAPGDYLFRISQDSQGLKKQCKTEEDTTPGTSEDEPDASMEFTADFVYPFYVKISANICP